MLRRVLAIYLAFVLAAGPGLCCCASARLIASPVAHAGQDGPPAAAPQGSCCHCPGGEATDPSPAPDRQQAATGPEDPAGNPTPDDHRCPCREHGSKQKLDRAASPPTPEQSPPRPLLPIAASLPFDSLAGSLRTTAPGFGCGDAPPLPFLSAWELLHVHHLLRC